VVHCPRQQEISVPNQTPETPNQTVSFQTNAGTLVQITHDKTKYCRTEPKQTKPRHTQQNHVVSNQTQGEFGK